MKVSNKISSFFIVSFIILSLTACSDNKETLEEVNNLPHYSQITALESNEENSGVYKIENKGLYKIGTIENLLDLSYNNKNAVYVYLQNISKGKNFNNNKIVVIKDKRKKELKDFYAALDFKLNPSGDKLAFRSFKEDSRESAEGMRIYDIKKNKYINLKSNVLVSGNLYGWINENKIIYYGSIEGQKNSDKIYSYDFNTNKEEVYLDDINGYCTYFVPMGNNILFLAKEGDSQSLYYFDAEKSTVKSITNNIYRVSKSVAIYKNGEIFFIGSEDEKQLALYKFSSQNLKLERITYDFPKELDEMSGIAVDDQGNVYFGGTDISDQDEKVDVYMYDNKERSINLISTHEGKYSVYNAG